MSQRIAFRVEGKVQGVSFRYFTKEKATEYGLIGWVQNLSSGDVQGEVQGDEETVKKFLHDISKGPPAAMVEKVKHSVTDVQSGEEAFEVRKT